jgi:hypothetical protein
MDTLIQTIAILAVAVWYLVRETVSALKMKRAHTNGGLSDAERDRILQDLAEMMEPERGPDGSWRHSFACDRTTISEIDARTERMETRIAAIEAELRTSRGSP